MKSWMGFIILNHSQPLPHQTKLCWTIPIGYQPTFVWFHVTVSKGMQAIFATRPALSKPNQALLNIPHNTIFSRFPTTNLGLVPRDSLKWDAGNSCNQTHSWQGQVTTAHLDLSPLIAFHLSDLNFTILSSILIIWPGAVSSACHTFLRERGDLEWRLELRGDAKFALFKDL